MAANMKPGSVIVCPSCGTRNRPKWEFCVSCGESLKGVAPEVEAKPVAAPTPSAAPSGAGVPWLSTIAVIGLLVAAFLWLRRYQLEPARPDPAIFADPGARPSPATATTPVQAAEAPGQSALSRGGALLVSGDAAGALRDLAAL